MIAKKTAIAVGCLVVGAVVFGTAAQSAQAQVYYYSAPAPVYVAPTPVYVAPAPIYVAPPVYTYYSRPAYYAPVYCAPAYRSYGYTSYGRPVHYGSRGFSFGFSYRH